jgi:putative ABC transport system permease protein
MLSDSFLLAIKNLKKRGIRSWLTVLGVFIGIAAVVSLISLSNGLQTAITGQFSGTLSTDVLVFQNAGTGFGPPGSTAVRKINQNDIDIIESVPGVKETIPRLIRMVKFEYNDIATFNYIASIPKDQEKVDMVNKVANLVIVKGNLLEAGDKGKVVLGDDFIKNSPYEKEIHVGSSITIQGKKFEVKGILKRGSSFQINSVILMPEDDLKDILNIGDEYDIVAIKIDNPDNAQQIADNIVRKIRKDRNEKVGEEDFTIQTPAQALQAVSTILGVIGIVVTGIAAISLIIGGIGIANTMFTSVLERTREIGVMKAIGAKNSNILSVFLIESGLLGLVGGIAGALFGLGAAYLLASVASQTLGINFPVTLSWPLLLGAIAFSFFIGLISGIIPAIKASRMNPVEALRK